jgi:drug/metabolite transporter (DMT)-like permease
VSSRGVLYMVVSALGFSAMAVLVKLAAVRLPTGELVLARAAVTLVLSYLMVRRAGVAPLGRDRRGLMFRGLIGFSALAAYYVSLARLSLADAATLQNATPLLTAVLAWRLLGERIGAAGVVAIVLGLLGVVLVIRPGGDSADSLGLVAALASALLSATAYVTVRKLSRTEHPLVIVMYFPLVALPLAVPWAATELVAPTPREWLLLFAIGATTQIGQVFMTLGLAVEQAGRAMSINYLQVCFAMAWQLVVFGEQPAWLTIAGAALIIGGTIAVSATAGRRARPATSPPRQARARRARPTRSVRRSSPARPSRTGSRRAPPAPAEMRSRSAGRGSRT